MTQLDRYVGKSVLLATLVVILVIVGLDAIFTLVDELDQLKGAYGFVEALQFMLLRLPRRAYEYMPMACLIGCLAGLGSLAASSELTVMRAAGLSVTRIIFAVIKPVAVLMVLSMAMAEYAIPTLERIAQSQKAVEQGKGELLSNKGKGYWHREGDQFMRFRAVEPNGVLHGITVYYFTPEKELYRVMRAERAIFQRSHWQLQNVHDQQISEERSNLSRYSSFRWESGLTPESLSVVMIEPRDMSISNLFGYAQYLEEQDLNADNYLLSFWKKVTQPLSTFALVLLGAAFIFGPLRQVTAGSRIFSGILVGLVYKYLEEMLAPASIVLGFAPIMASIIPIFLSAVIGLYLLRRSG
ncbi:LPS export ABC transporter permease LptG [Thalassolituus maritimus]|uniref:LPS export ABC transporter permease LptG n=1 Tax=Thalassolituus maritimus TaxID=484498 RepID=A0ABP9ZY87_9GAMM